MIRSVSRCHSTDGKVQGQVIGVDLGIPIPLILSILCLMAFLGTTNSAVCVMEGKSPRVIENAEGQLNFFFNFYDRCANTS